VTTDVLWGVDGTVPYGKQMLAAWRGAGLGVVPVHAGSGLSTVVGQVAVVAKGFGRGRRTLRGGHIIPLRASL
jgi:hypothetical protein